MLVGSALVAEEVINDLTSESTENPLSAAQGKILQDGKLDKGVNISVLDIYNWTGSQSVPSGSFLNYLTLAGIAKDPDGTAGIIASSNTFKFPPSEKPSQVTFNVRITGTVGGSAGTPREWLTQTRRADGTTLVGSAVDLKVNGTDISNRDSILASFTKGVDDPFSVGGVIVGLSNISGQTMTLTSVSIRMFRTLNPP
ncbi:putative protease [Aeromonas phage Gekk3-15]